MKKTKWILLAEDDAPIAELSIMALAASELACEIIVANDGLQALDCIHRRGEFQTRAGGDPAFVLLDLKMPKVDGLDVLRHIKSDAQLKNIPVVMFTSSREAADISRCYQSGANAYVVKPVDFQKFHEALKCVGQFWAVTNEVPRQTQLPDESDARQPAPLAATV